MCVYVCVQLKSVSAVGSVLAFIVLANIYW